jgi:hypothetical protein
MADLVQSMPMKSIAGLVDCRQGKNGMLVSPDRCTYHANHNGNGPGLGVQRQESYLNIRPIEWQSNYRISAILEKLGNSA